MNDTFYHERRRIQKNPLFKDRRLEERREVDSDIDIERRRLEKRRSERKALTIPVSLLCNDTEISCLPHDLSSGGITLTVPSQPDLMASYIVRINFHDRLLVHFPAKILYSKELKKGKGYSVCLQFAVTTGLEKKLIATILSELPSMISHDGNGGGEPSIEPSFSILKEFNDGLRIKRFPLIVNGDPFDTGRYDYYPYVDRLITDRKTTMTMMHQLKKWQLPKDYEKYVYGQYCIGDSETNDLALQGAYEASQEFRRWPLQKRKKIMEDIHSLLLEEKDQLVELMVIEGHPVRLALWEFEGMEAAFRRESLEFFTSQLRQQIDMNVSEKLSLIRRADGVVCVIPPKNAAASNSLIAGFALLGGNAVIVKPPLRGPIATIYLWSNIVNKALKANHAPKGVLSVITGNSNKILENWMKNPLVNDIIYFGDSLSGIELGAEIYRSGRKPILELSGSDLMFVWKDAPVAPAVKALLEGFLGSTQICMVPKKALIHEEIYEEFKISLVAGARELKAGLPTQPDVILSPVMKITQFYKCLNDALEKGAKLLCGGERINHLNAPDKNGVFITPAILEVEGTDAALEMDCFREENFFPLIPIIKVTGSQNSSKKRDEIIFEAMISVANKHTFGLRLSAWAASEEYIQKFSEYLHNSGLLRINSRHIGFSLGLATHGGTKKSGGPFGEMNYIWQKTTHLQGVSVMDLKKG